jgi:hypothetical protein
MVTDDGLIVVGSVMGSVTWARDVGSVMGSG